jgi:hypothetical protein
MADEKLIREILVNQARMETKQDELIKRFGTHLRHHWAATLVIASSTISLIVALIFLIL